MKIHRFLAFFALVPAWAWAVTADDRPLTPQLLREGIRWPGEGGRRIEVSLAIYLVDFARINLREESFDMAGYLDTAWVDPGLKLEGADAKKQTRRFRPGQVWTPALEFVNAAEQVNSEREGDVYVDDSGRATQRVRFSHRFHSPMRLKRFPFDEQTLTIEVAAFDHFAHDLDLVIDREHGGRLEDASVTDWDIERVWAELDREPESPDDNRFAFKIQVARRSTFYLWRILMPITLLIFASWIVFWFEPMNLQPQISTGLAILLSLVTFTYAVDFSLPKVAYLTFIDRYTLTAFSIVLATLLTVTAIHIVGRGRGVEVALKIQKAARFAFPAAYLAILALITGLSFS